MGLILKTSNEFLNMELSLLTSSELDKLAQYAYFLRWSRTAGNDWAEEPLTFEKEAGLISG